MERIYELRREGNKWYIVAKDENQSLAMSLPKDFVYNWLRIPQGLVSSFPLDRVQVSQILSLYKSYNEVVE